MQGNDWDLLNWDASNPSEPISVLRGHTRTVRCVASNGSLIASGSEDETVKVHFAVVVVVVTTLRRYMENID